MNAATNTGLAYELRVRTTGRLVVLGLT